MTNEVRNQGRSLPTRDIIKEIYEVGQQRQAKLGKMRKRSAEIAHRLALMRLEEALKTPEAGPSTP